MGEDSLTAYDIAVLSVLRDNAVYGEVEISTREIARNAGTSRSRSIESLRRLERLGLIEVIRRKGEWGGDLMNRYRILSSVGVRVAGHP